MKPVIKTLVYIFIILVTITIIFFVVDNLFSNKEVSVVGGDKNVAEKSKDLFVVSGEFVCLPLKDENTPHNDLCAFGIKNDNDEYYRLQSMRDDKFNLIASLDVGQKIEISGLFIIEESNTYKTLGTIEVDSVEVLVDQEIEVMQ